MLRLGPHQEYRHDHRASLRDVLIFLKNRLVQCGSPKMMCVEHKGRTWRPTHSFHLAHCEHVVYTDGSQWAFDIDEFGWGGIREPNMGLYATFDHLINGVAHRLVAQWKLAMPIHIAIAPQSIRKKSVIGASLAEYENAEALARVEAVRAHPGSVDSVVILGTDEDMHIVLDITCKHAAYMDGVVREWHEVIFRRTDPAVVEARTASFWERSRQEFVQKTWHPSRFLAWCLPVDDVRDMQENFLGS